MADASRFKRVASAAGDGAATSATLCYTVGTVTYNTNQRRTMDARLLEAMVELAPTGIYAVDANLRLLAANPRARDVFGSEDWVGRDFVELIHSIWPSPYADFLLQKFRHTLATGERYEHSSHSEQRRDRGAVEHYHWCIHRVLQDDGPVVICHFSDISEEVMALREVQRQREELQTTLDLIPIGVGIARDPLANDIDVSPRLARMLGIPPKSNASLSAADGPRSVFRAVRDGVEIPHEELPMQKAARTAEEQRDVELDVEFSDGHVINLLISAAPLFHPDGSVRGAIGSHVDVSALKRIQRQLESADRHKDEFLAMLAHELRNPLAPLRNAVAILQRMHSAEERQRGAVDMISRQVTVLSRLVDDLLDISRITQDRIQLRLERVQVAPLIEAAIEAVAPLLRDKQHELSTSFPGDVLWVLGDPMRLMQCLVNLLTNATKYTDDGGRIEVRVRAGEGQVVISIEDSGAGLSAEFLPRAFELFAQSAATLDRSQGGLGIGLALVRRIVELHGGQAGCRSEGLGMGSTFEIRLPLD